MIRGIPRVSRPRLRSLLAAAILLVLFWSPVADQPRSALAFSEWCWDDPVVAINGMEIHTVVGVLGEWQDVAQAVTSTTLVYQVPAGVSIELISSESGILDPHVQFVTSDIPWNPGEPIPVTITVSMESSQTYPAQVVTTLHGSTIAQAHGNTDTSMVSSFLLSPAHGGN